MLNDLIRGIRKSVIYIETKMRSGTDFFIDEHGLAVTCRHVVENIDGTGTIQSGVAHVLDPHSMRYKPSKFKIKGTDNTYDLAIIKVEGDPFESLELDDDFGERIAGEEIAIFGFPFVPYLNHPSLTKGIISAIFTDPRNGVDMIQTDVWIYEASSGSPCFLTKDGTVIGYATSSFDPFAEHLKRKEINVHIEIAGRSYKEYTNICFVIPAKYIRQFLE